MRRLLLSIALGLSACSGEGGNSSAPAEPVAAVRGVGAAEIAATKGPFQGYSRNRAPIAPLTMPPSRAGSS